MDSTWTVNEDGLQGVVWGFKRMNKTCLVAWICLV